MENEKPLLTIAIPTYNGARTIRNMLDILIPQVDSRVEIIISDNCSTDETQSIAQIYQIKYAFIKYVRNDMNIGADRNFLQCMRMADGKFTMLVSDDDIIIENSLHRILSFLAKYPLTSLAYLHTISFKDHYIDAMHCTSFKTHSRDIEKDIVTKNKKEFFSYADRQWGFTSSFLWATERMQNIENADQYFDTYWLQSYVHILCSNRSDDQLGIISGPCIAAGEYGIMNNYDVTIIEAVHYKKMLDFAIIHAGYEKKQLYNEYIWKVCYLGSRTVVKQRTLGINKTNVLLLIQKTWRYPYAWIALFPFLLIPPRICKIMLRIYRKKQGRSDATYVNRTTM